MVLKNKYKNKNLLNNQNYVLGNNLKRKIISNFLAYKTLDSYNDDKVSSYIIDGILDMTLYIFNIIFRFLNRKLNIYLSALIVHILLILSILPLFLIAGYSESIESLFFVLVLTILLSYRFLKSNLSNDEFNVFLKMYPANTKFSYYYKFHSSKPGEYGVTKSFIINIKNKKTLGKKFINYIGIMLFIFISILLFFLLNLSSNVSHNGRSLPSNISYNINSLSIYESNNLLERENKLYNLQNGNELTNYEKGKLDIMKIECYEKLIEESENKFIKGIIIKDTCEEKFELFKNNIIKDRINLTDEELKNYISDTMSTSFYLDMENFDKISMLQYRLIRHNDNLQ